MIMLLYSSKKELQAKVNFAKSENGIGLHIDELSYYETSIYGAEIKPFCIVTGSNRPSITGMTQRKFNKGTGLYHKVKANEFFASLKIVNGYIVKVS